MGDAVNGMREERRIVTALFADIVGSTTISERLDPEDAREVLGGAIARVIEEVDTLGGTVKDLAGDGVLALFGAPVAHEDDAERAVLCGLRIAAAIVDDADDIAENWGVEGFSVRVGIETGPAVLGPVGGGSRIEYGATGDAINTASRLQGHADPGTVLVGGVTRAMVEDRFTWGPSLPYELKGKERPVAAATALAYSPRPHLPVGVFGAPLVGRDHELDLLSAALAELRDGSGGAVTIVGDAGVGKSRLVDEMRGRFAASVGGVWLEGHATSYATSIPYLPYRHMLLSWLHVRLDAPREAVEQALDVAGSALPNAGEALRRLRPLLAAAPETTDDPEALQEEVFTAFGALVGAVAEDRGAVVVLEDLHWSDATSLALTERLAPLTTRSPVLLLATTRPEPAVLEVVGRLGCERRIELLPLSRDEDRELLEALVGKGTLPSALEERLLATTDGNPFFVEELVRGLVGTGALRRAGRAWTFEGSAEIGLAPTIERALLSRIDRLNEDRREVLLAASVLGARFDRTVLGRVVDGPIDGALRDLVDDGFLDPQDDVRFRFRHALVQEAAYGSLLKRRRRVLHERVADALETAWTGRTDEIAGTLGRHLAEAGERERAVPYLLVAARAAASAFSNDEAASLAAAALELLPSSPEELSSSQRDTVVELARLCGDALDRVARHEEAVAAFARGVVATRPDDVLGRASLRAGAPASLTAAHRYEDAEAMLDEAERELGERTDEAGFRVWLSLQTARGDVYYWRDETERHRALMDRVRPAVEAYGTDAERREFYEALWAFMFRSARFLSSDETLRLSCRLWELDRDDEDPYERAWAAFTHGLTLLWHGDLEEAEIRLRESLDGAVALEDASLRSRSLSYLLVGARLRGDVETAAAMLEEVLDAARAAGFPEYEAIASATAAWVAWRGHDAEGTRTAATTALELFHALPNPYPFDWMAALPLMAVALDDADLGEATARARDSLEPSQQPLREPLRTLLASAVGSADDGAARAAAELFADAVVEARALGYL